MHGAFQQTPTKRTLNSTAGFTIIELLIVIVVIGILAAIIIVSYTGVQQKAHAAALQSDIKNATQQLELDNAYNGTYPATKEAANNNLGLRGSPGTTYQYTYTSSDNSFCLTATYGTIAYMTSSANLTPTVGVCPGHTPPDGGDSGSGGGSTPQNGGVVTTLAGTYGGYVDGAGTVAKFSQPSGVAVDSTGNVYVADKNNNRIRKITPDGTVSTLAGSGTAGFANGTGTAAQFYYPQGVAVDSAGNVYVADAYNYRIRKITPSGVVTTFAGSGVTGSTNGASGTATFNVPFDVDVDSSGNVYVADYGNSLIRKITSSGTVSTLAGSTAGYVDGTGTAAKFDSARNLTVDSAGNVYVVDTANQRIRKITPSGVVTTIAGSGTAGFADGTGTSAQFYTPGGIAVDSAGNLFVADYFNYRIRQITPSGVVSTIAGSSTSGQTNGTGAGATFYLPVDITIDASGTLYVADYGNNLIRKVQ